MADLTISQLSRSYTLSGSETVPVSQKDYKQADAMTTFFTTVSSIADYVRDTAIPPGVIWTYAAGVDTAKSPVPKGWLLCDGSAVRVSVYRRLYQAISDVYGESPLPGILFRVPNLKGRFIIGYSSLENEITPSFGNFHGSPFKFGSTGGEFNHTLTVDEMPSHNHVIQVYKGDTRFLAYPWQASDGGANKIEQDQEPGPDDEGSKVTNVFFHPTMKEFGGNRPHNNTPPFLALNYLIKY